MNKVKFELEFPIHASPSMLYQHFSTPSGQKELRSVDITY